MFKYCIAIANEGGGHLVLGVTNKRPRRVVGSNAFNNPVEMAEKLFQAVGLRVDIEEVAHPEGRVVVFQIPSRPRGTAYHRNGACLMRCGESLVPMSEDQLRKIFKEGEPDWLEQHSKVGVSAEQVTELLDTRGFFRLLHLPYPTDRGGVLGRLLRERLIDRVSDGFAIRRLAGILLANELAEFPDLARKAARVVAYKDSSKIGTTIIDRTTPKGYAVGFQGLIRFTNKYLPQNELSRMRYVEK